MAIHNSYFESLKQSFNSELASVGTYHPIHSSLAVHFLSRPGRKSIQRICRERCIRQCWSRMSALSPNDNHLLSVNNSLFATAAKGLIALTKSLIPFCTRSGYNLAPSLHPTRLSSTYPRPAPCKNLPSFNAKSFPKPGTMKILRIGFSMPPTAGPLSRYDVLIPNSTS